MMRLFAILLLTTSWPAFAQADQATPPTASETADAIEGDAVEAAEEDEIVVVGGRSVPRGSVVGDIAPEVVLNARDIRAYGASTIGELLTELAPLTGSIQGRDGGGQPVVLLGGRRISSFREIRDLPPEAVVRVDILPEEVALKYGYRADQKVVNFVLRRRFEAVTAELDTRLATAGGRQQHEGDVNYLRINEGSRLSIDAEYERSNPLFESERDLIDADPDRTLLSASDAAKINGTYNRTILGNVSATISAELSGEDSRAALGRSTDGSQRLLRDRESRSGSINYALNGDVGEWRWSLDGGYVRDWSTTLTDRNVADGVGRDRARSVAQTIQSEATANGDLFALPAGDVSATFKAGFNLRDISSASSRLGVVSEADLSRDQVAGQANVDLPLLARDSAIGAFSANANAAVEELSDFGTLTSFGYGFNWKPITKLSLIGSVTHEDGAPSIQQLGNPVVATPNVRVFDVTRGETVDVTLVEGGNPDLRADSRRVIKLGLTLKPIDDTDLTLIANYTDSRTDNPTASFPTVTPEIEAAFPDRFLRDAGGTLLRIDSRPVNFARSNQRQFRWGFNWSETLEAPPPTGPDGQPLTPEQIEERRAAFRDARRAGAGPDGGPGGGQRARGPGGGDGGGFGRGPGGGGGARQGRVQVSLFHTWRLEDTILIREGVPELDLLGGSAIGGRGGQPQHQIELTTGYNRNGLGVRLNGNWQSGTTLIADPSGAPSPNDLTFGSFFTANLRLFADLGQQAALVRSHPFFRSSRVTLAVDNLFDERLDVRDASGATPIGYQPDLLDPLGRSVRLSFRKLFF